MIPSAVGLRERLLVAATALLGAAEADAFDARLAVRIGDIAEPLQALYGESAGLLERSLAASLAAAAARPEALRRLDRRREIDPGWFQDQRMQGYVCYVDRFCGTLAALPGRLDYLAELGTTYLHLMPLLRPRPGENDGGYAVMDYREIDPRLGTMADLRGVANELRSRGISLCIDVVLNHTAREHAWARGWVAGDPRFADFYTAFLDRRLPDAYDATTPPVFPDRSPGSFTWYDEVLAGSGGWVWTTFWPYQWDLNYANPEVLLAMLGEILWLANQGVEIFRMDAVPFMWKRLGTNGQNQPEVHDILQVLHGLVQLAAPATVFKAEAIVAPADLVPYLGGHDRFRPECELAYHNQLMVLAWSSLATRDAGLATQALRRMQPIPATTSWVTYVRGHDDIGWAITDADAQSVGWDAFAHRRFLNDFYAGTFPGSFARGALFQHNDATGDARISGSAASLCGIEDALRREDETALTVALRRLILVHAVAFGFGGIPLLYMGDEVALRNDPAYLLDPALRADNRWMHRPQMDWAATGRRHDRSTVEGRTFEAMLAFRRARAGLISLRADAVSAVLDVGNTRILAWTRRHPRSGTFLGLANFHEDTQVVDVGRLSGIGPLRTALSSDGPLDPSNGSIVLPGLGFRWLTEY